jgi:hypothetical protein
VPCICSSKRLHSSFPFLPTFTFFSVRYCTKENFSILTTISCWMHARSACAQNQSAAVFRTATRPPRRSQWPRVGLRPLGCWGRGFESRSRHGYLSVVLSCVVIGLYDGLITRPEESYRVSVCVWSRNPEREAKCPSWSISACELMNELDHLQKWLLAGRKCRPGRHNSYSELTTLEHGPINWRFNEVNKP